jgi:transcriptional regulator
MVESESIMYIPHAYRETDLDRLVAFMQANSFISLVSIIDQVPVASHIPVVVTVDGEVVKLTGHLAKANPQAQVLGQDEVLAIFSGPHAYISPTLYEKWESVPTWNYIAVHAYGVPQPLTFAEAPEAVRQMLATMIDFYEEAYQTQWADLPETFREGMMRGIIGFELVVTRLEGKAKLSQNRSQVDQATVARRLVASPNPTIGAVGQAMVANLERRDSSQ